MIENTSTVKEIKKFKQFFKKLDTETVELFKESPKTFETQQKIVSAWMLYQTIRTNKQLVWATWILAIATIILSILTFIFG